MKLTTKILLRTSIVMTMATGCNDFLEESPQSQVDATVFYKDKVSAEIGLTGCYNRLFNQYAYPYINLLVQVSADDISQPAGSFFKYKTREDMTAGDVVAPPWNSLYKAVVNVNYLLQEVEKISVDDFGATPERKAEILAEAHFIRGVAYYYLWIGWGDVPLITAFPGDIDETLVEKAAAEQVQSFIASELTMAATNLPDILETYEDDPITNQRKGRASKWAAKAYLARLALHENDWQTALDLSNEIIDCGLYPFTGKWRTIFRHPMNASESIFEQQNDLSPGFFGSGIYGWFFGYDFEWSDNAFGVFEKPDEIGATQGKDVRFDLSYTPRPNKYIPVRGFDEGGVESMNFTIIRLTELLLNKAEALNELDFSANSAEVIDILNMIRARAEDESFVNEFYPDAPVGTTGIAPLDPADYTTQDALRQAIHDERRRELMFEDVVRWADLMRWDREYLKTVTNSPTDNHLYWPIPPDEIVRNPRLAQNPAYQ